MLKAGLANTSDVVVVSYDTSERVSVKCAKGTVIELRGDIVRMFGYLTIRQLELRTKKDSPLPYPKLEIKIFTFILISSRVSIMVMLLFPSFVLLW